MRRVVFALMACAACGSSEDGGGTIAPGDAAVDSTPPGDDGGPPPPADGGTDAHDAAVDAGPPFCASLSPAPKFCDDFDDLDPLTKKWDQQTFLMGISSLAIDETQFASAPASLLVQTTARPVNESSVASLRKSVAGTPTRAKLSLSIRPSATTWTQGAYSILDFDLRGDGERRFTLYFLDDDDANGHEPSLKEISGSTITYHALSKVPPANTWTRITLDVDAEGGKVMVLYGSETILDATVAADTMNDPTFRVGSPFVFGPSDAWNVNVDDVVFDF